MAKGAKKDTDEQFDAALKEFKQAPAAAKAVDQSGLYYAIASIVVAVVAFIFSDLFYLNTQTDLAILAGVAAPSVYLLGNSYVLSGRRATKRAALRIGNAPGTDAGQEGTWYAIFSVNFWYFVIFGVLAYVLLPQMIPIDPVTGRPSMKEQHLAWIHSSVSILTPAVLVWLTSKNIIKL